MAEETLPVSLSRSVTLKTKRSQFDK